MKDSLRRFLLALPGYREWRFRSLGGSVGYWDRRYASGENSGDGSYGLSAEYKAAFLNRLIEERKICSAIEFGCGDGNQLALIQYPQYVGLDVSPRAVGFCARRFAQDPTKSFLLYGPHVFPAGIPRAELALSLDVIYHLVEDDIYELYLRHLFGAATRFVVIYANNENSRSVVPHVRPRRFVDDVTRDFGSRWMLTLEDKADFSRCGFFVYEPRI